MPSVLAVVLALAGANLFLAQEALARARETVKELQAVASPEEAQRSIHALKEALAGTTDPDARALFLYTLGWLHERSAEWASDEGGRARALTGADGWYAAMLAIKPGHPTASRDLARVRAARGDADAGLEILRRAFGDGTPDFLWSAGDVLARAGRWKEALSAYLGACRARPEDSQAAWRIVGQLPAVPDAEGASLLAFSDEMARLGFVGVALEGWAELVSRREQPDLHVSRALVSWVGAQARRDALDEATLARLPAAHPEVRELRAWITDDFRGDENRGFWLSSEERSMALFEAMRARARAAQRAGDPERAERLYDRARRFPSLSQDARLTIALDLALLYHVRVGLPDADRKFEALERELFEIKGAAYLGGDLETIEHSHRTLATIYLERGVLGSPESLRGARYHVQRAIDTARRRAERGAEDYAPYPDLSLRLAERLGRGTAAVDAYLSAAQGFLDVDDLSQARRALDSAGEAGAGEMDDRRSLHADLLATVELRDAIRSGRLREAPRGPLTGSLGDTALAASFVERQEIRALADLGERLWREGDASAGELYRRRALERFALSNGVTWREVDTLFGHWPERSVDPDAPPAFVDKGKLSSFTKIEWLPPERRDGDRPPPQKPPR